MSTREKFKPGDLCRIVHPRESELVAFNCNYESGSSRHDDVVIHVGAIVLVIVDDSDLRTVGVRVDLLNCHTDTFYVSRMFLKRI